MPRVTKSVTAKANTKKFYMLLKVIMVLEVDLYKTAKQSNIKSFNMLSEIEKIEKRY